MLNFFLQDTAQEGADLLADGEQVEKTLSIIELIASGGLAGQIIIGILFLILPLEKHEIDLSFLF